ncbi:unnamed protein product [Rotaria sordida]|uniref:Uncharacterized protein n=1 Tax=Rotaria sordida TaxID=392033 RepID=A0A815RE42_9BILA|nr:unnamed protein product [Rotaria sordida]CAF1475929.1 unnamed protein product [Rotaria sordida]CAF3795797.1 unnamed protein product [Rotaria sordida]
MKSLTSPNTTSAVSNFTTVSSSSSPLSSSTYQQLQDKTDPNEISLAPVSSPTASISFDASTKITTPFITPAQFQRTIELNSIKDKLNKLYSLKSTTTFVDKNRKTIKDLQKKEKILENNIHELQ